MRILLATDHYPPFIGGAHRQARLLAHWMSEHGHEVAVATPWHGGMPLVERRGNLSVHRLRQLRTALPFLVRDNGQRHQPPYPDPVTITGLRRLIAHFGPDLIHSYGWLSFSVAVALHGKRIPLLISARDYGYFCANRTLLRHGGRCSGPAPLKCLACSSAYYGVPKGWLAALGVAVSKPLLRRKAAGLHSVSGYVHDVTKRHFLDPERLGLPAATIPSFLAEEPTPGSGDAIEPWLSRLPKEPFMLFVGAFRKVKGLETLFAAYRRVPSPPPLVLMGTYERDSPAEFPPEAIVIADAPHEAVMAAWDRALFGIMPSLWPEPLGATVLEAMSRGRAVIGTRDGGHAQMLDETTGVLIPQSDPDTLAAAMQRLIDDSDLREELGRAAAKRAREFTASNLAPRFEEIYRAVIASTPR